MSGGTCCTFSGRLSIKRLLIVSNQYFIHLSFKTCFENHVDIHVSGLKVIAKVVINGMIYELNIL